MSTVLIISEISEMPLIFMVTSLSNPNASLFKLVIASHFDANTSQTSFVSAILSVTGACLSLIRAIAGLGIDIAS